MRYYIDLTMLGLWIGVFIVNFNLMEKGSTLHPAIVVAALITVIIHYVGKMFDHDVHRHFMKEEIEKEED